MVLGLRGMVIYGEGSKPFPKRKGAGSRFAREPAPTEGAARLGPIGRRESGSRGAPLCYDNKGFNFETLRMKKKKNMWTRPQWEYTIADIDRWSNWPPETIWAKWCGGVVFPGLVLWPAMHAILTKSSFIPGRHGTRLDLIGRDALLFGYALIFIACFSHTHYFWGNSKRLRPFHEIGKTVSLLGFCITFVWLLIRLYNQTFTL